MSQNLQEPIHPNAKLRNDGEDSSVGQATPLPSSDTEAAIPSVRNQEVMSGTPVFRSPDAGGVILIIKNWLRRNNHSSWIHRLRSRRLITIALISFLVLLIGSSLPFIVPYLHTILPASTAKVTITPASQNMTHTYTVEAVTGTPTPSQVPLRSLSYTTVKRSKTVQATGQGSEGVTQATGTLIFSNSSGSFTIFAQSFVGSNGVVLVTDSSFNIFPSQTVAVFAHAAIAGTTGNVPVDDINGTFNVGTNLGTIHGENTSAFTGGTDQSYAFVQQSDIDVATASLTDQLTSEGQTGLQKLTHADEQLVIDPSSGTSNAIQCTSHTTSDHKANDRVTTITVTGSVTCQAEAYVPQAMQSLTSTLFQHDVASHLGPSYSLIGNLILGPPQLLTIYQGGFAEFTVDAQGIWVFQFNDAQKQQLARSIAGKTQADTIAFLRKQAGVHQVELKTSGGWGDALPTSPGAINMAVLNVSGL